MLLHCFGTLLYSTQIVGHAQVGNFGGFTLGGDDRRDVRKLMVIWPDTSRFLRRMTSDSQPHASIIQFCCFFITRLLLRNPTTAQVSSPRILLPAHLLLLRA